MMTAISSRDCIQLRYELNCSTSIENALSKTVGGTQIGGGLWRFFSPFYPKSGVVEWNSGRAWKKEWDLEEALFYAFGEDLFGNQLVLRHSFESVHLWNHENGSLVDLFLDPATLLETIVQSGLDWIDFYNDGSLKIAEKNLVNVPSECHLHWTTPLILGGQVSLENTSVVDRSMHLVGHAKLWRTIRDCAPGTLIIPIRDRNS